MKQELAETLIKVFLIFNLIVIPLNLFTGYVMQILHWMWLIQAPIFLEYNPYLPSHMSFLADKVFTFFFLGSDIPP